MLLFHAQKQERSTQDLERRRKNMKIISWRKFLTFVAVVLLFTAVILHQCSKEERQPKTTESYTIHSGETLWSIGTKNRPQDMSIQEYIYRLETHNGITADIRAGQTIELLIF